MSDFEIDKAIKDGLRVQKNRAQNTYLACIDLPDGHRETFEHFDREVAIEQVKLLAQDYNSKKGLESIPSLDSDKASWTISTNQDGMINGVTTPISDSDTIENIEEGWKLSVSQVSPELFKATLTTFDGCGYVGFSPVKSTAMVDAVMSFRRYEDIDKKSHGADISRSESVNREQLASDIRAQEKVMAGLIEKGKRSGIDERLIYMAATKFEFGFMALDKALTTDKE